MQLMLELRTITWFMATRGTRIGLDRVPSAALVEGLLAEWGKEKRDAAKKREHVDCDELIAQGRWLSREVKPKADAVFQFSFLPQLSSNFT
jgi:hypothetical protein